MEDYRRLRELMVDTQLVPRGIKDERVLRAMRKVQRQVFMPESARSAAYEDRAVPIGESQTISQPYMVAIMSELLELTGSEKVLEIGAGSGYQAAILGELSNHDGYIRVLRTGPNACAVMALAAAGENGAAGRGWVGCAPTRGNRVGRGGPPPSATAAVGRAERGRKYG